MINLFAHVSGRPYHTACKPSDCTAGVDIGDNVNFTVVFFANPDPNPDPGEGGWEWSFQPYNLSSSVGSNPEGVTFTIKEGYVVLNVDEVTMDLFGNYTVTSHNVYGSDQTVLQLIPEGRY